MEENTSPATAPAPAPAVVGEVVEKHPGGAPGWWTEVDPAGKTKVDKLEAAFLHGCTDEEACLAADITYRQLRYYQEVVNPSFVERKKLLKMNPVMLARATVNKALKDDPAVAFRFLERRKKDEFAPSATVHVEGADKVDSAMAMLAALTGRSDAQPLDSREGSSPPDGDVLHTGGEAPSDSATLPTAVPSDRPASV